MDPTQQPAPVQNNKMTTRTKVALWLLIGPSALLVATFILSITSNLIFAAAASASGSFSADTPIARTAFNILFFLMGAAGVLTWLPGLITGIVLLATKPTEAPRA
jgi:hypothetical protein